MILNANGSKPIYIQISEWIETEILNGNLTKDDKVYSQYKLAELFTINPATAAKGLNLLADEGILYTKRGLGKFVTADALTIIMNKRKNQTLKGLLQEVALEAERLYVTENELVEMLGQIMKERKGDSR
ncbi:GntR family transcriptional regulator [Oceanobacillus profundus]|uniref:GntR family transcriptional regulator n=1 Tax=Oceanobacillus profundus TaxID=372463 RepID=A0A417YI64_9BACI|nr:GntR family transcriptional regulator [Oceanobacillus profundus]MCM3399786.1 GntR family transcriptional regulator [Oceanobacillus profundus]PAE28177.1 GntR family transcriptional regulator [Paenibacillus sp. 7884-2]RHW32597.1 GntR family transcriptional regulator [Oceanobacillus profundus]